MNMVNIVFVNKISYKVCVLVCYTDGSLNDSIDIKLCIFLNIRRNSKYLGHIVILKKKIHPEGRMYRLSVKKSDRS